MARPLVASRVARDEESGATRAAAIPGGHPRRSRVVVGGRR
jgi:hypothetical protein